MKKLILVSNSPRRKELLKSINAPFCVRTNTYEENIDDSLPPDQFVIESALEKVKHLKETYANEILIGADTIVHFEGKIIGKPKDMAHAKTVFSRMCGTYHDVYTGLAIKDVDSGSIITGVEKTRVYFEKLTEDEIDAYLNAIHPLDKAGAYAIQGHGALVVNRVEGCYYNVIGFPLVKLANLLKEVDFDLLLESRN